LTAVVLESPDFVSGPEGLEALRAGWAVEVDAVEYLPVGFGAHHWRASCADEPRLFVTLDRVGRRHTAESLEAAYTAAAELAAGGLEFVVPCLPDLEGCRTAPLAGHRLSCVPWLAGKPVGTSAIKSDDVARQNAEALGRLHAATPPATIASWGPRVGESFGDSVAQLTRTPWRTGPYGEPARRAVVQQLDSIRRWTDAYHELCRRAEDHPQVPTHGEPHTANQLRTGNGIVFVDWESLALAPRERDLGTLVDSGYADPADPDWDMVELFDLEWRLTELAEDPAWLSQPHTGTGSDRTAYADLLTELTRPDRTGPAT
jgi:spectinomycin phosphotransferase